MVFPPKGEPLIYFQGIYKTYNGKPVLQGIDLEVRCGETLVLLGRSGAGKSVLTSMLVGLETPDAGAIILNGVELTKLRNEADWDRLRLQMGYLFQGSALYDSMTVGENIAFPLVHHSRLPPSRINQIVKEKLALVGLKDVEELEPSALSGGMQRRVALARTLALDPHIIIYDEPTTGLDPITSDGIAHLIRDLQKSLEVTSILVTHDIRTARFVGDRLAMLYDGKIVFVGTCQELDACPNPEVKRFLATTPLME
ncbi:MAG: ABC transporter ATP-binding protein [Deltaproteobacteria bacterium]|nr:ABC transporter ATP-binding protein [Deltaproteobacteria bacterium]MBW1951944.1 ABC transporter ATP-binding protein [Deltaproteobacteria bacterium]MBW1986309.1 ABC transporter ATP-binding protein [Deltaproteobacteria bacterium]MBW2134350.1 ABC transporter ATP-binding protein [Deltaproteobacteria bacterium]